MSKAWLIIEGDKFNDYFPRRVVIYGKTLQEAIKDNLDIFRDNEWVDIENPSAKQVYDEFCEMIKKRQLDIFSTDGEIKEFKK